MTKPNKNNPQKQNTADDKKEKYLSFEKYNIKLKRLDALLSFNETTEKILKNKNQG